MARAVYVSFVVVGLTILAGCTGQGSVATQDPGPAGPSFDETTGAIEGLVTDDQYIPIRGAVIMLDGDSQATADESGRFAFGNLEPGPRTLLAGAIGFQDQAAEVAVEAGALETVHIVLLPLGIEEPYHEIFQKTGMVACSVGYRAPNVPGRYAALCGVPGFLGVPFPDDSLNVFNEVGFGADVTGITFETVWESTQALGDRMEIVVFVHDAPLPNPTGGYNSTSVDGPADEGTSPLREPVSRPELDALMLGNGTSLCSDHECYFEIGHYANADPDAAIDVRVVLQQRFDDYVTVFHYGVFDPLFSAVPDA